MNIKTKIKSALDLIKSDFVQHKLPVISHTINDTPEKEVEIIKRSNLTWHFKLSNFICNINRDECAGAEETLIISYDKLKNIVRICLNTKTIRPGGRRRVMKYIPINKLILTVNDRGCFIFPKHGVRKLSCNSLSRSYSKILTLDVKIALLNLLENNIIDRLGELTHVPSKFKDSNDITHLRMRIDPGNNFKKVDIHDLIRLYSLFRVSDFKKLGKTANNATHIRGVLRNYYANVYSIISMDYNVNSFINLCYMDMTYMVQKLILPPPNKIMDYINDINHKRLIKSNNAFRKKLVSSSRGLKRMMNTLIKLNFKFTHEWIESDEQLKNSFTEIGKSLFNYKKQIWLKIYIKRTTFILGTNGVILTDIPGLSLMKSNLQIIKDNVDYELFKEMFNMKLEISMW